MAAPGPPVGARPRGGTRAPPCRRRRSAPVPPAWEHAQELAVPRAGPGRGPRPAGERSTRHGRGSKTCASSMVRGAEVSYARHHGRRRPAAPAGRRPPRSARPARRGRDGRRVPDGGGGPDRHGHAPDSGARLHQAGRPWRPPTTSPRWRTLAVRYPMLPPADGAERLAISVAPGGLPLPPGHGRRRARAADPPGRHDDRAGAARSPRRWRRCRWCPEPCRPGDGATPGPAESAGAAPPARAASRWTRRTPSSAARSPSRCAPTVDGEVRRAGPLPAAASTASRSRAAARSEVLSLPFPARRSRRQEPRRDDRGRRQPAADAAAPGRGDGGAGAAALRGAAERALRTRGRQPRREAAALRPGRDPGRGRDCRSAGSAIPGRLERNPAYRPEEPAQRRTGGGRRRSTPRSGGEAVACSSPATGCWRIEIPPEVLAQSPGLGDLRLVADGRQLPYILERGSLARRIVVPARAAAGRPRREVQPLAGAPSRSGPAARERRPARRRRRSSGAA